MDIALYRCRFATGKGKLCFIKRKDKVFLSDNRVVLKKKFGFFECCPF